MKRILSLLSPAIIFLFALPALGADNKDNWEGYAFISYRKTHPLDIVEEGNNFDVLFSLKKPQTCEDLNASGIRCDKNQLKVLERNGLIKRGPDGFWKTCIAIFDQQQTALLREFSKSISGEIYAKVRDNFISFTEILKENGWERNAYSICFSYVLDNKMWNHIITQPEMESHHSWRGCIWYLSGDRSGINPGTNTIGAISQTWEESIQYGIDYALLTDIANGLSFKSIPVISGDVRSRAESIGLCDSNGKPLFPVIREKDYKDLVSLANAIGKRIAEEMKQHINGCGLLSAIEGKGVAEVILSHELIWDVLEQLVSDGIVELPASLRHPESGARIDLSELIFISY